MWRASVVWPKPFTLGWADRLKFSLCPYSRLLQKFGSGGTFIAALKDSVGCDAGELRSKWAVRVISHILCFMQAGAREHLVSILHLKASDAFLLNRFFFLNIDAMELGTNLNKSGFHPHLRILSTEGLVSSSGRSILWVMTLCGQSCREPGLMWGHLAVALKSIRPGQGLL